MLPDGESADEKVVLLHVRGKSSQSFRSGRFPIDRSHPRDIQFPPRPEGQRVEQCSFSSTAGAHQGE